MKCSQDGCTAPAIGRYTWPGRDEAGICADHRPKLVATADACGFHLQVVPVPVAVDPEPESDPYVEIVDELPPERGRGPT